MAKITTEQKSVIRKIIYAVETGGQVYGQVDYNDFTEAYTNSSSEHAITIGGGQWYGTEALALLKSIRSTYPALFKKKDTAGIGDDMDNRDWSTYKLSKDSEKAKCIQSIISCPKGIKCQDKLMDKQMLSYIAEAEKLGVTDLDAQMMCANFRHQGGLSAVKRILQKTPQPYTLDNLYNACKTDTGNQVGAYTYRQKFVYDNLKKYISKPPDASQSKPEDDKMSVQNIIERATSQMEQWANDSSHGYDQIYRWGEKGDYDCSAAVISAWQNAGVPVKTNGASYTGNMLPAFKKCGFQDITSQVSLSNGSGMVRGDVLLNTTHHTAMYIGNGQEVEASINEKGTATGGTPGDQTGKEFLIRSYRNYPWTNVLRYTGGATVAPSTPTSILRKGSTGEAVKTLQKNLNTIMQAGLEVDGDFGTATYNAVVAFQKKYGLEADGEAGPNTQAKIQEVLKSMSGNTGGSSSTSGSLSKEIKKYGFVTASSLNVRTWAGTDNPQCSFSPLRRGTQVGICDTMKDASGSDWLYICYNGKYGFVLSSYID